MQKINNPRLIKTKNSKVIDSKNTFFKNISSPKKKKIKTNADKKGIISPKKLNVKGASK